MKTLLIVESPAKAKTISKYLGDTYVVRASIGHVRDLPKSNKKAIDLDTFTPHYEISRGKEKVVSELHMLAKKADTILLATDPDREGEAIAWHLSELLTDIPASKIKRVTYHEITKDAILEALSHPRPIDQNLRKAQEARRVLDRLVGYDLSGLIWKKVRYGLSAGRVQSPALRILVEREREIQAFIPEKFWSITADLQMKNDEVVTFTCVDEPRDKKLVDTILSKGKSGSWRICDNTETEAKRSPRAPFITSTLQQTASTRLGFSPSRTMRAAQKLYEAGHITYMRTDSTSLSKQALGQIAQVIEKEFGKEHLEFRTYAKKSKNAQEAHEAIRPTNSIKKAISQTGDEGALYELIWQRTVASQMSDAKIVRTKILAEIVGEDLPHFAVNGSRVTYLGWLMADPRARGEDVEVPQVAVSDPVTLVQIHDEEKQTQPPSRYSEAGLIKELEKRGIGRPSTYASIINTIEERGYVEKDGRTLKPTDTGEVVSTFLENNFSTYISDTFTANMEDDLDRIAEGNANYTDVLTAFYTPFKKEVASKEHIEKLTTLGDAPKEFPCPECNKPMVIKLGKNGKFLSCSTYPDCKGARKIDGSILADEAPIGVHPDTKEPIFVRDGRFGPYVQLGEKTDENPKPKRASLPKGKLPSLVTLTEALHYLALPRTLGHTTDGKEVIANIGRFGPYIGCDGEFRSLKKGDDPYTVTFARAQELLSQPKALPKGVELVRDLGKDPKGKKTYQIFKSKSGMFVKSGRRRIYLPTEMNPQTATIDDVKNLIAVS